MGTVARDCVEIAIIGCGPYGLSAATHLHAAGHEVLVFGEPLQFWREHTPKSMLLRSPYHGSNIGDPKNELTLQAYERASHERVSTPIPVERFVSYGEWFQRQATVDFDQRDVTSIERMDDELRVTVDGDVVRARRVVVAAGIGAFPWRPSLFEGFDRGVVSHTRDHRDLSSFAGSRVTVIGGGQSALESAALLNEAGADVDVLVRSPVVNWLSENSWRHTTWPIKSILYSRPDVGPAFVSHLVATPAVYRRLPPDVFTRLATRSVRPAGAAWLRPRLDPVRLRKGLEVVEVSGRSGGLQLRLSDETRQTVDHVLLGTGYRIDVTRYPFMSNDLGKQIVCDNDGYPRLTDGFETSVPGLHIVGAPAARHFGPLMRFVAGSKFAGQRLARGIS
jgi:thioredoxin reductase